jgi:3-hydroxyisobutyrate dehydrogenase-like beta-hydroxyacid dehydrogenase
MKRIGFIGLGMMGSGMASNLIKKGFDVTVWNRDSSKTEPLVALGAKLAEDLPSISQTCDVVITMLRDDQSVKEIIMDQLLPETKPGVTFIDMTTVTPEMCRRLAEAVKAKGCHYIEGPVMGSKEAAQNGQLVVLAAGPTNTIEANREILMAMAKEIVYIGPNGSSAWIKLANNQLVAALVAAFGESLALIEKAGLDRTVAIRVMCQTIIRLTELKQPKINNRDWSTQFALDLMYKDILQTLKASDELNIPMPVLSAAKDHYQKAFDGTNDRLDFSLVVDRIATGQA